ncbi:MAG: 50S ribosomal protein L1 [Patescibacteria group bacterium]
MVRIKSKKFQEGLAKIDEKKRYPAAEAIALIKSIAFEKFDASLEVHIRTGVDARKGDQLVRASVILPHGTGKTMRVAVFAEGEKLTEAKAAGADVAGDKDLIEEIKKTGKADFDVAIATPDMMKNMAVIAKVLGPRGLMPSPKNDTVTNNIKQAVENAKKGKVDFRNDSSANIHQAVGKLSFTDEQLLENYKTFIDSVKRARPSTAKGTFFKNITMSSTMGPAVMIVID